MSKDKKILLKRLRAPRSAVACRLEEDFYPPPYLGVTLKFLVHQVLRVVIHFYRL